MRAFPNMYKAIKFFITYLTKSVNYIIAQNVARYLLTATPL